MAEKACHIFTSTTRFGLTQALGARMAGILMYLSESDVPALLAHLNASEEIAFIVSNGPGRWIAVKPRESLAVGSHCLWHIPSGPLPLFRGANEEPGVITNPFEGWSEVKAGADATRPYFGAGHPGVFWLSIYIWNSHSVPGQMLLGLSSFEWIGNHYRIIGSAAKPETEKYWKGLGRWVKKHAVKVPRGGPQQPTKPEIWAFRGAQALFEAGVKGGNV